MEDDIEFKTIPTVQCSTANDQCVKVKAVNEGAFLNKYIKKLCFGVLFYF